MTQSTKPFVIALEEHYADPLLQAGAPRPDGGGQARSPTSGIFQRLPDLGEVRLRDMDAAGIDVQVLSHTPSPVQQLEPDKAVEMAIGANDRLAEAVARHPERFAGFAALPTPHPGAAAEELERCVRKLGFKGAMIHGRSQGAFHDDERFYPIFERAQALDVPIYLHPGPPHPAVVEAYYGDFIPDFPWLTSAAWGYTIDTANQAMRMVLSGLFNRFPDLKIILGHLGEGLPFMLDRMDEAFKREGSKPMEFKKTFCDHFYVTTSGFFSTPALLCTILQMGIDRVLFSVDWPFVENLPGMRWMETVPLSEEDKGKMLNGNARRLLKMQA
ncbi:MAG TPA: amidohydrolase family protein [Dehalococcoidia bacterium]|nr:amidohydrolase family protein [Dehalococcoidia bacterium]